MDSPLVKGRAAAARYCGICATRMWEMEKKGLFPKPISLGERSAAWIRKELDAWIAQRIRERDKGIAQKKLFAGTPKSYKK